MRNFLTRRRKEGHRTMGPYRTPGERLEPPRLVLPLTPVGIVDRCAREKLQQLYDHVADVCRIQKKTSSNQTTIIEKLAALFKRLETLESYAASVGRTQSEILERLVAAEQRPTTIVMGDDYLKAQKELHELLEKGKEAATPTTPCCPNCSRTASPSTVVV